MSKIRKAGYFKFIALSLAFLFVFQADTILSVQKGKTDHEKQYELAKKEVENRQFESAQKRLQRLLHLLNRKIKEEKRLLKKVNALLKKIRKLQEVKTTNVIEKPAIKPPKKKKKFPVLLVVLGGFAVVVAAILLLKKKDKSGEAREQNEYTLMVTKGTGVNGSPESGTYTYREGERVNYSYSLQSGYTDLTVTLDGNQANPSGSITMNANHTLSASGVQLGSLRVTSSPGGANIWINNILRTGVTPITFENMEPGQYEVTVRAAGYRFKRRNASVSGGQQTDVSLDLVNIKFGNQLFIDASAIQGFAKGLRNPDWYWFYVRDPGYYTIDTYSAGRGMDIVDNYMHLYGPDDRSNEIETDDDDGTDRYARISIELDEPGNYFVKIRGYNSSYKGFYMIRVFAGQVSANHDEMKNLNNKKSEGR